jgi:succinylglutamate desuccinylase
MDPGYENFQAIQRGQRVAVDRDGDIGSPSTGRILMPLYQGLGEDGFFVARDVSPARMQLSVALRKLGADNLLPYLPGVTADPGRADVVRVAGDRPMVVEALRLLGYRKERAGEGELLVTRRRQAESRKRGQGGATERIIVDEAGES